MKISFKTFKQSKNFTILFGFIFLFWSFLVIQHSNFIKVFDDYFISILTNYNPAIIVFTKNFTILGNTKTIVNLTIILFIIFLFKRKYNLAIWLGSTMAVSNLSNYLIKILVKRSRPSVEHLVYAGGFSYPSGHSDASATLCGLLIIFTLLLCHKSFFKTTLVIILALIPLLIGYTRIFLHVHYPSDVLGGWLEGSFYVFLSWSIYQYIYLKQKGHTT